VRSRPSIPLIFRGGKRPRLEVRERGSLEPSAGLLFLRANGMIPFQERGLFSGLGFARQFNRDPLGKETCEMAAIYYDSDADMEILRDKTIAIIGYGNQGRAQALNMRDSGIEGIVIGGRKDEYLDRAASEGFEIATVEEASRRGDIVFLLIPDEIAPSVYRESIEPRLKKGAALNFASGYNITFGFIVPPPTVDVIMVAPRMIGEGVRECFLKGEGFPSFIAVEQDATGRAREIALGIAKAIGSTKRGAIEVSFRDETIMDLMAEQVTWPLVLSVFTEVFRFQVEKGIPEEAVLMELYVSKEPAVMLEKMADMGLFRQMPLHSHTSQYGQLSRFKEVDKGYIRAFIEKQFERIESGEFASEWRSEQERGLGLFKSLLEEALASPISQAEERLKSRLK
jgi:ketol-acid reductoisomerase